MIGKLVARERQRRYLTFDRTGYRKLLAQPLSTLPPALFSSVWLLDLALYRLDLTEIDTLHPETIGIIALGAVLFSLGGMLALLVPSNILQARLILTRFPPRNKIIKPAVLVFLGCSIPLLLRNLLSMAANGVGTLSSSGRAPGARISMRPGAWAPISFSGRSTRPPIPH